MKCARTRVCVKFEASISQFKVRNFWNPRDLCLTLVSKFLYVWLLNEAIHVNCQVQHSTQHIVDIQHMLDSFLCPERGTAIAA